MCLKNFYEPSASTFAINDQQQQQQQQQHESFEVTTKERLVNDQGLVLFARLGCGKRCANVV